MPPQLHNTAGGSVVAEPGGDGGLTLRFAGRLDSQTTAGLWLKAMRSLKDRPPQSLAVDAGGVEYCDGSGVAMLFQLKLRGRRDGFPVDVHGLKPDFQQLLDMFDEAAFAEGPEKTKRHIGVVAEIGSTTLGLLADIRSQIAFVGELCTALAKTAIQPWRLRRRETFWVIETAGANAVGLILMIGLLFGLILAFSSAIPLQEFGTEIYVMDLVSISLLRVLGPFIAGIILAARSGSAFAAELGTMKVNYEIDALNTMGVDPVYFLVVPRVVGTVIITPLLAVLTIMAGLIGAAAVVVSLGYPMVVVRDHVTDMVDSGDLLLGLGKSLVFGALVAGVSCLRGLQTKTGPSAVGESTTKAVVASVVLLVVAEGVFSVLVYFLDI
jgi:phospholipid/cholesterol/gamma-HCH transport system permease protein